MTDYFALLDERRRPWLDPGLLKEKFLALSAEFHPDRTHQAPAAQHQAASQRFTEINAAYNCLREPKERLRHLLELELGAKPPGIGSVPPEMLDSLFEVGLVCREVDAFLAKQAAVTSPVMRVQWFKRAQDSIDKLQALRQKIDSRRAELDVELKSLNAAWENAASGAPSPELPLARLDEIYRLLGFLARWSAQIQERIVQLSM